MRKTAKKRLTEDLRVFAENVERYDHWYEKHVDMFQAELEAVHSLTPSFSRGIEIGVGTGRFAEALGLEFGVDPAPKMIKMASERGVKTMLGVAESLPCDSNSFDFALMTTTICFLNDVDLAFTEVHRILKPDGCFIAAFIDADSHLGAEYKKRPKASSPFYSNARFFSTDEIIFKLAEAGLELTDSRQTIFPDSPSPFDYTAGYGEGAFVVLKSLPSALLFTPNQRV